MEEQLEVHRVSCSQCRAFDLGIGEPCSIFVSIFNRLFGGEFTYDSYCSA